MKHTLNLAASVCALLIAGSAGAGVVTNGLVAWWSFNNPGNPGNDDYGTYTGALTGCTSTNKTAGTTSPAALSFNGVSDKVTTAAMPAIASNITVEAWVYPFSITNPASYVGRWGNPSWVFLGAADTAGKVRCRVRTDSASHETEAFGPSNIATGTWSHVAGTFDGVNIRVYVNGVVGTPVALEGNLEAQNVAALIGSINGSSMFFDGIIDEVRVYNRTLSQNEIRQNIHAISPTRIPPGLTTNGLVSWWTFNSPSDPGWDDYGTNNGTLTGCTSTNNTAGTASSAAISFNGSTDKFLVGIPQFTNNFTVESWIYPRDLVAAQACIGGYPAFYLGLFTGDGRVRYTIPSPDAFGPQAIATGTWNHIVGTYDGANVRVYVNGVSGTPVARTGNIVAQTNMYIGRINDASNPFNGIMDETRIYNRALTTQEILQNMKAIRLIPPGAVMFFR